MFFSTLNVSFLLIILNMNQVINVLFVILLLSLYFRLYILISTQINNSMSTYIYMCCWYLECEANKKEL